MELGFLIPLSCKRAVLPIPKPRIPDSTSKHFPDSGIRIPLHLRATITFQGRMQEFLIGGAGVGWGGPNFGSERTVETFLWQITIFIRLTTLGAY